MMTYRPARTWRSPCSSRSFYEIPVPRPWTRDSEREAYANTLEQAVAGERFGWDAFWTVEHHFLEEYSHCSNPEVLYGAIAARTERIRLGYGVRLMPKPYNHPVRTAESTAVLDLISGGRVDVGTGRSSTRAELEGFGIDPHETRQMWAEAIESVVKCWTEEVTTLDGEYWQMPRSPGAAQAACRTRTRRCGAPRRRRTATARSARWASGCARSRWACRPRRWPRRSPSTRRPSPAAPSRSGSSSTPRAATFTMTLCAPDQQAAHDAARESFEWYPKAGARLIGSVAEWMEEQNQDLGNYGYAGDLRKHRRRGAPRPA